MTGALEKTAIFNFDSMNVNYKIMNLLKVLDPFTLRSAVQLILWSNYCVSITVSFQTVDLMVASPSKEIQKQIVFS